MLRILLCACRKIYWPTRIDMVISVLVAKYTYIYFLTNPLATSSIYNITMKHRFSPLITTSLRESLKIKNVVHCVFFYLYHTRFLYKTDDVQLSRLSQISSCLTVSWVSLDLFQDTNNNLFHREVFF